MSVTSAESSTELILINKSFTTSLSSRTPRLPIMLTVLSIPLREMPKSSCLLSLASSPANVVTRFFSRDGLVPEPASAVIFNSKDFPPCEDNLNKSSRSFASGVPSNFSRACSLAASINAAVCDLLPFVKAKASCITLKLSRFASLIFLLSSIFFSVKVFILFCMLTFSFAVFACAKSIL